MKKFICKAPWTSIAFQPSGKAGPCCVYELDELHDVTNNIDQIFQTEQQQFLNGEVPRGCTKCHNLFLKGESSYADSFNGYTTDFTSTNIQEINIKANNNCNFACRSCGPHFSSKWEDEFAKTIKITKDKNIFDKINLVDFSKLKTIVFAGGEPTLQEEHVQILTQLVNKQTVDFPIRVSTNVSSLTYKGIDLVKLWKNFPKLHLQLSIDATGVAAEAIRSGTDWTVIDNNLRCIVASGISHYVNITVSALNIWFLEDTLKYLTGIGIKHIAFNILSAPDIMSLQVIPPEYTVALDTMLSQYVDQYPALTVVQKSLNSSLDTLWQHFLIYNLMLDQTRQEKFFACLPIKSELINQWVNL
jgi:sulfatase maturation enzyme AslB (radical SAM superfamily)